MKAKRNEPCPCGSGRKYKHCCMQSNVRPFPTADPRMADPDWVRMRRTEGNLTVAVLEFGAEKLGRDLLTVASEEFEIPDWFPLDQAQLESFFIPWALFTWLPEGESRGPLALQYLERNASQLNQYEREFIRTVCAEPFSFFVITEVVEGKSLGLRDIFLERTFTVKEATASRLLRKGDVVFGRVVALEGQAIMVGMGSLALLPRQHLHLIDVRRDLIEWLQGEGLELDAGTLLDQDYEMRNVYFDAADHALHPCPPELRNTDGDPLTFVRLYYELKCSTEEAVEELKPLAGSAYQKAVRNDLVYDNEGKLVGATIPWHGRPRKGRKAMGTPVLGSLTIDRNLLTVEVNSENRARKIQARIEKRLGESAVYKRSLYESLEKKLEEMEESFGNEDKELKAANERMNSSPEIQALMKEQIEACREEWYETRIPLLHYETPVEAARTRLGRERLEALLNEIERRNERLEPHMRADIDAMRKRLGL